MFKLFKGKKKAENNEPAKLPVEMEIQQLLSRLNNKEYQIKNIDFKAFSEILKNIHSAEFYSLCRGSDDFAISVLLCGELNESNKSFTKQLNELNGLEVLQYNYSNMFYDESLWSLSTKSIYVSDDKSFFIFKNELQQKDLTSRTLTILHSREFLFGTLLMNGFMKEKTPVDVSYNKLLFFQNDKNRDNSLSFSSTIIIGDSEYQFIYILENKNKSTALLVKELIKEQCRRLEKILRKKAVIKQAGIWKHNPINDLSGFTLTGTIHTPGTDVPYEVIFPKKLINLFPDYSCTTIKGKILQINKELLRREFQSFYKSQDEFLLSDYLSNLDERDLNLICQNFFLSHGINGDKIKQLFYFRVKLEEKSRMMKIPFIEMDRFLTHLPLNLKERFYSSKTCSDDYNGLIRYQKQILDLIYRDFNDGKLLLSFKSRFLLDKELGSRERENKTRRLRKLISDKRFINSLDHMDNKKAQVLLSNMKNILIVDTFIYQTDELVRLKSFLSQRRFHELQEDIKFTQGKIKSNQIDINRICDSIDKFNSNIRDFVKNDKEKEQ